MAMTNVERAEIRRQLSLAEMDLSTFSDATEQALTLIDAAVTRIKTDITERLETTRATKAGLIEDLRGSLHGMTHADATQRLGEVTAMQAPMYGRVWVDALRRELTFLDPQAGNHEQVNAGPGIADQNV